MDRIIFSLLLISVSFVNCLASDSANVAGVGSVVSSPPEIVTTAEPKPITSTNPPNTTTTTNKPPAPTPKPSSTTTITPPNPTSPTTVPTPPPPPPTTPTTTTPPSTTSKPSQPSDRKFDAFSFIGGFALAIGLVAIGFLVWKLYISRRDDVYHTL